MSYNLKALMFGKNKRQPKKKKKKSEMSPMELQEEATLNAWRGACKRRDKFRCLTPMTTECNGGLQVHHCVLKVQWEKTKYLPDNGVCLCQKHHFFGAHSDSPEIQREYDRMVKRKIGVERFLEIEKMKGVYKWSISDLQKLEEELNNSYRG